MARVYATAAQYEETTGQTAPADIDARLRRASRFLDSRVFRLCRYDVAEDGMPSNEVVAEAFAAAVSAQVWAWDDSGDELGTAGQYTSVSIGSVSLSGGGAQSGASSGGRAVADTALEALRTPDLTPDVFVLGWVTSWG
ncbi:hypothetical protein ACFW9O_17800 [Streptomyces sp. NPDC059499]|uniref:hypothetical protein n=1 Tax=Streptomyces sp. NPDC059499 TaxID=3346852 RepID=UPI00369B2446